MGPGSRAQLRTRPGRRITNLRSASRLHRHQRRHQAAAQRLRRAASAGAAAIIAAGPGRRILGILRDRILERRVLRR